MEVTRRLPGSKKGDQLDHDVCVSMEESSGCVMSTEGVARVRDVTVTKDTGLVDPFGPSTPCCVLSDFVAPVVAPVTLCLPIWIDELKDDFNADFVRNSLRDCFMIVDRPCSLSDSWRRNYRSCLVVNKQAVEDQIWKEVSLGRYVVTQRRPTVISSLGAVLKKNGKVRLIHDLSRLDGGINRFGVDSSVSYSTLDDALGHFFGYGGFVRNVSQHTDTSILFHANWSTVDIYW